MRDNWNWNSEDRLWRKLLMTIPKETMKTRKMAMVMTMMMTWLTLCMSTRRRIGRRSLIVASVASVTLWPSVVFLWESHLLFQPWPLISDLPSHQFLLSIAKSNFRTWTFREKQIIQVMILGSLSASLLKILERPPDRRVLEHSWRVLELKVFGSSFTFWKWMFFFAGLRTPRSFLNNSTRSLKFLEDSGRSLKIPKSSIILRPCQIPCLLELLVRMQWEQLHYFTWK